MKKVIYVAPHLNGYGIRLKVTPLFPDLVAIDWQLRLISQLNKLGYEVSVKQHPETKTKMSSYFFQEMGAKEIIGPFEDVISSDQILIFDSILTTTYAYSILSGNPIVLINFNFFMLKQYEKDLLLRRIALIEGSFCKDNRAQINWDELEQALERCLSLNDKSYQESLLAKV